MRWCPGCTGIRQPIFRHARSSHLAPVLISRYPDTWGSFYLSGSLRSSGSGRIIIASMPWLHQCLSNLTRAYPPNVYGMRINRVRSPKMTKSCSHSAISRPGITLVLRKSSDSYSNNGKASNTRLGFNDLDWWGKQYRLNTGYAPRR